MKPTSKRFDPSIWSERLIPLLLIVLVLGLVATIVVDHSDLTTSTVGEGATTVISAAIADWAIGISMVIVFPALRMMPFRTTV